MTKSVMPIVAPAKSTCTMFSCEATGRCMFPDNCDERGYITRRRDRTPEEQRAIDGKSLEALGEKFEQDFSMMFGQGNTKTPSSSG